MLTDEEKRELLEDAKSEKRKRDFARSRLFSPVISRSLDDYLRFLKDSQKLFPFRTNLETRDYKHPLL